MHTCLYIGPEKCGRVIIWSMTPILSFKEEKRDDLPKKLCQMDNHLACINCVRWSNHGKYLASAGDDKNLMVWQLAGRVNQHFAASSHQPQSNVFESANVEQWRCIATLNGHNGDILDLSWSPNDQYLASCSVDNIIIVWDATNFPQVITKITGHTGLVKGVSWDPIGKFLASQSDDKTLRIWRTGDWREETVIKEPFKECGGTTHVLRLNWSPDGQTLVSAHAMNNSGSVAQLIERDGWRTQRDLVGHRKAITCVRFNPNVLNQVKSKKQAGQQSDQNKSSNNNNNNNTNTSNGTTATTKTNTSFDTNNCNTSAGTNAKSTNSSTTNSKTVKYCCIAVGSRDRSISVWLTSQPRPLIVAHDLFESSVLDISWSKDGYRLIACSQDGTVAVMIFTPAELGHRLTNDEKQTHLQKLYGKALTAAPPSNKTIVVEEPELMKPQQQQQQQQHQQSLAIQQQNRLSSESNHLRAKELQDQLSSHSNSISQNGYNGCESNTSMTGMSKGPTDRQIETLLPGGKRRITPLFIQSSVPFTSSANITFSSSKDSKTKIIIETTNNPTPSSTPAPPTPSYISSTPVKSAPTPKATTSFTTNATIPAVRREVIVPKANQRGLAPSKIEKASVFKITDDNGVDLLLEVENDTNSDRLNELRLLDSGNNKIWDVLISSKINSVIATPTLAAASCLDNSLHLFDLHSGRRLIPPLVLDSPVAHIAAQRDHLLVITSFSNMWLWNLKENKVLVKSESVSNILPPPNNSPNETSSGKQSKSQSGASKNYDKSVNNKQTDNDGSTGNHGNNANNSSNNKIDKSDLEILSCSLTNHYQPLILLSNGKAFIFDFNLHCWLLISDSSDSISRWSNCKPSLTAIKRFLNDKQQQQLQQIHQQSEPLNGINCSGGDSLKRHLPLTSVQSQYSFELKRFASSITNKNGSESLQVKATRSYLDQQLASALAIRSMHEYHYWLLQSVQHYVDTGAEARLKDLCSRLITGTFGTSQDILGLDKRHLLREVLTILSRDLRYQRLYSEYKQLLEYDSSQMITELDS